MAEILKLVDRLRGIYTLPVNDGAGPLNGEMTYTSHYPATPINKEAADRIEHLELVLVNVMEAIRDQDYEGASTMCREGLKYEYDRRYHKRASSD